MGVGLVGVSPVEARKPTYITPYLKAQPFNTEVGSSCVPRSGKNALGFESLESIEVKPWSGN